MKPFWMAVKSSRLGLSQQSRKRGTPPEKIYQVLEGTAGNAEVEPLEALDTHLSEPTCEALAASTELVYRHTAESIETLLTIETQMSPACCCDEL